MPALVGVVQGVAGLAIGSEDGDGMVAAGLSEVAQRGGASSAGWGVAGGSPAGSYR